MSNKYCIALDDYERGTIINCLNKTQIVWMHCKHSWVKNKWFIKVIVADLFHLVVG